MVALGHGESSMRRRSAEPVYRDNIQLKDASVNISSEGSDSKRDIDDGLPVYDDADDDDGRHWDDSDQDKRDMQRMGKKQVS